MFGSGPVVSRPRPGAKGISRSQPPARVLYLNVVQISLHNQHQKLFFSVHLNFRSDNDELGPRRDCLNHEVLPYGATVSSPPLAQPQPLNCFDVIMMVTSILILGLPRFGPPDIDLSELVFGSSSRVEVFVPKSSLSCSTLLK